MQLESKSHFGDLDKTAYKIYMEMKVSGRAKTFLKKKMGVGDLDTCYNRYQDILYYLGKVQLVQV